MIRCTKCTEPLQKEFFNLPELTPCPSCESLVRIDVFPAMFSERPSGIPAEALLLDEEAGCFYHPNKKAVISCAACGRFLCALCDVDFDGGHLCTSCLETGKEKHKIKNLENHRTLHDSIALTLALAPILLWPFTLVTAPMAIFLAIRYWKAPTSIIPRTKIRLIAALFIAGLQVIGWTAFFYSLLTS